MSFIGFTLWSLTIFFIFFVIFSLTGALILGVYEDEQEMKRIANALAIVLSLATLAIFFAIWWG